MQVKVDHPLEPDLSLIRNAITFSGTPVKEYRAPPLLGADTKDVLATIGYDDARVAALKAQKIV
jgi:crotonobetainyl-CoA:carnitine CoA-transferase CaiB-like acyl-CoA transferase